MARAPRGRPSGRPTRHRSPRQESQALLGDVATDALVTCEAALVVPVGAAVERPHRRLRLPDLAPHQYGRRQAQCHGGGGGQPADERRGARPPKRRRCPQDQDGHDHQPRARQAVGGPRPVLVAGAAARPLAAWSRCGYAIRHRVESIDTRAPTYLSMSTGSNQRADRACSRSQCAARSAIISVGAFVLPLVMLGIAPASATTRCPTPRTARRPSSTAIGSEA